MEMEEIASLMQSRFPMRGEMLAAPGSDDDDFFKDLPVAEKDQPVKPQAKESKEPETRAYSNYSYSSSSILNDTGERIETIRRRYEDSTGRLKAVHDRRIGNKTLRTIWNKKDANDKGEHRQICSGDTEEFEKQWKETPFSKAAEQKTLQSSETETETQP